MAYPINYNLMNPQQQYANYFTPPMQQAMQQMPMQNVLSGKVIDSIDTVRVTDIPMDGIPHYFPKADGSEIYVKKWLPNGSTEVATYARVVDAPVDQAEEPFDFNMLSDKLDAVLERLNKLGKENVPKGNSRAKEG